MIDNINPFHDDVPFLYMHWKPLSFWLFQGVLKWKLVVKIKLFICNFAKTLLHHKCLLNPQNSQTHSNNSLGILKCLQLLYFKAVWTPLSTKINTYFKLASTKALVAMLAICIYYLHYLFTHLYKQIHTYFYIFFICKQLLFLQTSP